MNLMVLLEMAASSFGDRVAVQNGPDRLTYAELFAAAGAAGKLAKSSGATNLALLDVSSLALPVGLFGSACAGLPFAPLNYRLTAEELEELLGRIAPVYLVTDAGRAARLKPMAGLSVATRDAFLAHARAATEPETEWPMDDEVIATLLCTSGTTGSPKIAVLRQHHLVSYILGSVEFASAGEEEATLVSVPPYHIAGLAAILSSVYSGRRLVQLPSFSAEAWLELARAEQVTHAFLVPTMLSRIVDALEGASSAELPHVRAIAYGGGKMPLSIIERAMTLFPETDFTNAYGLTETSSTISVLGPDEHRRAFRSEEPAVRRRLTSVGQVLPTVEIEIRDEEDKPVGPGEPGEIWVRGEQVAGEYLAAGSLLEGGWFRTRDAGFLDDEGFLFLGGRVDDVIVRGGENMSPGEIEEVLALHPDVADCAVVGIPDEQWGEGVAAVVVPRHGAEPSVEALKDWVRERLRSARTPQYVEFRDELPYGETGKLLRRILREELAEGPRSS